MYFILYFHYKSIGYVWGGIKTISRPQKIIPCTQVLKFQDPPLKLSKPDLECDIGFIINFIFFSQNLYLALKLGLIPLDVLFIKIVFI